MKRYTVRTNKADDRLFDVVSAANTDERHALGLSMSEAERVKNEMNTNPELPVVDGVALGVGKVAA